MSFTDEQFDTAIERLIPKMQYGALSGTEMDSIQQYTRMGMKKFVWLNEFLYDEGLLKNTYTDEVDFWKALGASNVTLYELQVAFKRIQRFDVIRQLPNITKKYWVPKLHAAKPTFVPAPEPVFVPEHTSANVLLRMPISTLQTLSKQLSEDEITFIAFSFGVDLGILKKDKLAARPFGLAYLTLCELSTVGALQDAWDSCYSQILKERSEAKEKENRANDVQYLFMSKGSDSGLFGSYDVEVVGSYPFDFMKRCSADDREITTIIYSKREFNTISVGKNVLNHLASIQYNYNILRANLDEFKKDIEKSLKKTEDMKVEKPVPIPDPMDTEKKRIIAIKNQQDPRYPPAYGYQNGETISNFKILPMYAPQVLEANPPDYHVHHVHSPANNDNPANNRIDAVLPHPPASIPPKENLKEEVPINNPPPQSSRTGGECSICLDEPKSIILMPCAHVCVCKTCSDKLADNLCPLCRKEIESKFTVFI